MESFTAYQLRFTCEVQTPILLNKHKGSSIRGALFHALRRKFCYNKKPKMCAACPLFATCPICFLMSTVKPEGERGRDIPRPYTIEPSLGPKTYYQPGETMEFGMTMFSRALDLFPYVILAAKSLEKGGLGCKLKENNYRRGTFTLKEICAQNPLTEERQKVLQEGEEMVKVPDVPITHKQVAQAANGQSQGKTRNSQLEIRFLTPTRIVDQGQLVHRPLFRPLFQRLMERLLALSKAFSDTPLDEELKYHLIGLAEGVELVKDETEWVELESYSTRKRGCTPIGGFVGRATYRAEDWRLFLPWLVWGQFTHVGKDAVKGNGWYEIATR